MQPMTHTEQCTGVVARFENWLYPSFPKGVST